eukprot:CAMPEP_0194523936 /NCGR_PEP_ID=MMETSP0253-20130528/58952_1 /TAXON_ID=2966 /ORGANISM="Noctiluca scintillans" /LENGTH=226 /DNA_ID=CAMNT_0039368515 /DNA_START=174 /DNA_END=854 /DNA_ORIENTATION=+
MAHAAGVSCLPFDDEEDVEGTSSSAMLMRCCHPGAVLQPRLLELLGPQMEDLLSEECARISDYFRHKKLVNAMDVRSTTCNTCEVHDSLARTADLSPPVRTHVDLDTQHASEESPVLRRISPASSRRGSRAFRRQGTSSVSSPDRTVAVTVPVLPRTRARKLANSAFVSARFAADSSDGHELRQELPRSSTAVGTSSRCVVDLPTLRRGADSTGVQVSPRGLASTL